MFNTTEGKSNKLKTSTVQKTTKIEPPKSEITGVHKLIRNSIHLVEKQNQSEMWKNIVLAGGNTLLVGFSKRLQKELELLSPNRNINIHSGILNDSTHFASTSQIAKNLFENPLFCISKNDYDEIGPEIVHKKGLYLN